MHEILVTLNGRPGIIGCLLLTRDGMTVASQWGEGRDADRGSAFVASILVALLGVADAAGSGEVVELAVSGTEGRVLVVAGGDHEDSAFGPGNRQFDDLVVAAGDAWLVALTERHLELDQGRLDLVSAAASLKRRLTIQR